MRVLLIVSSTAYLRRCGNPVRHVLVHHDRAPPPRTYEHAGVRGGVEEERLGIPLPPPISIKVDEQRCEEGHPQLPARQV